MDSYFIQWFILHYVQCLVTQSCLTLCDPKDCSPLGFSVHGIIQARILERVAMPSSRGSSQPRDQTQVSHIAGRFFTIWATREALYHINNIIYLDAQIVQEFISSWLLCLFKTLNSHENTSNSNVSAPDLLQLCISNSFLQQWETWPPLFSIHVLVLICLVSLLGNPSSGKSLQPWYC